MLTFKPYGERMLPKHAPASHPVAPSPSSIDHVWALSSLYPLPTCFMKPEEAALDIFRECFLLEKKVPWLVETTTVTADLDLVAMTLYFNMGLCLHLRGLATSSCRQSTSNDMSQAMVQDVEFTTTSSVQGPASAYRLLVLSFVNNLGCLALEQFDFSTVQRCLTIGLHAMDSIDLPLSWAHQFTWCNPSAAA